MPHTVSTLMLPPMYEMAKITNHCEMYNLDLDL